MNNKKCELKEYFKILENKPDDYDSILEISQGIEHILIGESTHGTHEFYQIRADITKKLILEKNFNAIGIEGDWLDVYNINRYVRGNRTIKSAIDTLSGFKRFPIWMWRNDVTVNFIEWLYQHNSNLPVNNSVGVYGLDLYNLNASIKAIIKYLEKKDRNAAARAKQRYSCFKHFKDNLQNYGYSTIFGMTKSCEKPVIEQLLELTENTNYYMKKNGLAADEFFYIKQNARLVKNAEKYYRSIFASNSSSWNVRDSHMAETLEQIAQHLSKQLNKSAKIVTWAHNSHIEDAQATEFDKQGKLNIGELAREKYGDKALLIGFLTYSGYVTATSDWDGIAKRKSILPALRNSYEYFFHNLNLSNFLINLWRKNHIKNLYQISFLKELLGLFIRLNQNEKAITSMLILLINLI